MSLHPLLYDLLRSIEMESPQYPDKKLLWCGMDAATGMAQVAGIVPLAITLISVHDLYLKSAWPAMKSRRFDEIYRLLQQVHPDTPPLHKASRIPPMMSDMEFAAVHGVEKADVIVPYAGGKTYGELMEDETRTGRIYLKPGEGNITEVEPDDQ